MAWLSPHRLTGIGYRLSRDEDGCSIQPGGARLFVMPYKNRTRQKQFQRDHYQANKPKFMARGTRRAKVIRDYVVNYKKNHPCIDCGEDDWIVLEFDHRPGTVKRFTISSTRFLTMKTMVLEIAKCDVRCANCHRRVTYARRIAKGLATPL